MQYISEFKHVCKLCNKYETYEYNKFQIHILNCISRSEIYIIKYNLLLLKDNYQDEINKTKNKDEKNIVNNKYKTIIKHYKNYLHKHYDKIKKDVNKLGIQVNNIRKENTEIDIINNLNIVSKELDKLLLKEDEMKPICKSISF